MVRATPFYWFDGRVGEAVAFYRSVFDDAEVVASSVYPPGSPHPEGELMHATLRLAGQDLMLLDGGPHYALTPAASLFLACDDQDEVDRLWDAFCDGGTPMRCGWVTDRFGLTWQVVPAALLGWLGDPDPQRAGRVNETMLGMDKLDIATLRAAWEGTSR